MNGYLLTIAVLVVTAGRLGDMFGRKRVFIAGMVVFALGSVVSGAAGDQVGADRSGGCCRGSAAAPMLLALAGPRLQRLSRSAEQPRALGIWAGGLGGGARRSGRWPAAS